MATMTNRLEERPEIDTERLLLRMLKPGDVQPVYEIYSHPNVIRYWDHPAWTTREEAADFFRAAHDGFSIYTLFVWCVCRRGSSEVIGICAVRLRAAVSSTAKRIRYSLHCGHSFATPIASR